MKKSTNRSIHRNTQNKICNRPHEVLKILMGETIKNILETEMIEHLRYEKYSRKSKNNYQNGHK